MIDKIKKSRDKIVVANQKINDDKLSKFLKKRKLIIIGGLY